MKIQLLILAIALSALSSAIAQCSSPSNLPDSIKNNLPALAQYLTKNVEKDYDKACILFHWVATNIQYDEAAYKKGERRINATAKDVLMRKKAVCLGYSQLYVELCQAINLKGYVIDGYSKQGNKIPNLEKVDHAWSAIRIDQKWYLQDVTWASGSKDYKKYYCPDPLDFIQSHLPADPMWQLLSKPWNLDEFLNGQFQPKDSIFNFQESIESFIQLPFIEQQLIVHQNTAQFNPTQSNKDQLAQTYFDYGIAMNEEANRFQEETLFDSLIMVQNKMIHYFRLAQSQFELYDWQKENFANTLINQAVASSQALTDSTDQTTTQSILQQMKNYLLEAKALLQTTKPSLLNEQIRNTCKQYLEWVEDY